MFEHVDRVADKVSNPLKVTKSSVIEFSIGKLKDAGLFRFKKIIEFDFGDRAYSRYVIYSNVDDSEYVFEAFPQMNGQLETYLYGLSDSVPFSEEFLEVAGQRYLTTPEGNEYARCIMPEEEGRIDGVSGTAKVYDINSDQIEKVTGVTVWDYKREADGMTEFLNMELWKETGMFRIFTGELLEDVFYKFYQTSKG